MKKSLTNSKRTAMRSFVLRHLNRTDMWKSVFYYSMEAVTRATDEELMGLVDYVHESTGEVFGQEAASVGANVQ